MYGGFQWDLWWVLVGLPYLKICIGFPENWQLSIVSLLKTAELLCSKHLQNVVILIGLQCLVQTCGFLRNFFSVNVLKTKFRRAFLRFLIPNFYFLCFLQSTKYVCRKNGFMFIFSIKGIGVQQQFSFLQIQIHSYLYAYICFCICVYIFMILL